MGIHGHKDLSAPLCLRLSTRRSSPTCGSLHADPAPHRGLGPLRYPSAEWHPQGMTFQGPQTQKMHTSRQSNSSVPEAPNKRVSSTMQASPAFCCGPYGPCAVAQQITINQALGPSCPAPARRERVGTMALSWGYSGSASARTGPSHLPPSPPPGSPLRTRSCQAKPMGRGSGEARGRIQA